VSRIRNVNVKGNPLIWLLIGRGRWGTVWSFSFKKFPTSSPMYDYILSVWNWHLIFIWKLNSIFLNSDLWALTANFDINFDCPACVSARMLVARPSSLDALLILILVFSRFGFCKHKNNKHNTCNLLYPRFSKPIHLLRPSEGKEGSKLTNQFNYANKILQRTLFSIL